MKLHEILIIIILLMICAPAHAFQGWVDVTYYPINDEHETYSKLKAYAEQPLGKVFLFINPEISFTNNVPESTRDRSYITDFEFDAGYLSNFKGGVGYRFTENLEFSIIYENERNYTGYSGDWTGVKIRYKFGTVNPKY